MFFRPRIAARVLACLAAAGGLTASVRAEGAFASPSAGRTLVPGSVVEVRWSSECEGPSDEREAEVLLSLDGGSTFPVRVTPEMSACSTGFRWVVPALATDHARLAIRTGRGEGSREERIELVSGEFRIAPTTGPAEVLTRGAAEWWTREALEGSGADRKVPGTLAGKPETLTAAAFEPELTEPDPMPACAPDTSLSLVTPETTASEPPSRTVFVSSETPRPLRL